MSGLSQETRKRDPLTFICRLLSEVKITDMESLKRAVEALHTKYKLPHVVITSINLDVPDHPPSHYSVVGSTMTSTGQPRLFKILFPAIDCYFSGTGDMFAALMVVRIREAVQRVPGLSERRSWRSDDGVAPLDLPLARAAERVLASMHEVLSKTQAGMQASIDETRRAVEEGRLEDHPNREHLLSSRAAELRLARNLGSLAEPTTEFRAQAF